MAGFSKQQDSVWTASAYYLTLLPRRRWSGLFLSQSLCHVPCSMWKASRTLFPSLFTSTELPLLNTWPQLKSHPFRKAFPHPTLSIPVEIFFLLEIHSFPSEHLMRWTIRYSNRNTYKEVYISPRDSELPSASTQCLAQRKTSIRADEGRKSKKRVSRMQATN